MALTVRITPRRALIAGAALLAAGLGVAWSGIIHIGASTGHWAITDVLLHWAMRNTVRTYAALTVPQPATDASGLVSAAGHYAGNCAVCHGAPGEPPSPLMQAATPHAPDLSVTAPTYSDAQLFWIVKHGIKFTGMPAWPALGRDDEIRRMAAFVRRLPEMSAREYRELAYGADGTIAGARPVTFDAALAECERCHAEHGRGQTDIPILSGQKPAYLLEALEDFAAGRRDSGVMQPAAVRVDLPLRRQLAEHYGGRPGLVDVPVVDPADDVDVRVVDPADDVNVIVDSADDDEVIVDSADDDQVLVDAGVSDVFARDFDLAETSPDSLAVTAASVVANGIPGRDVPPCANCHSPGKRAEYPILAGQKAEYLAQRLRGWRRVEGVIEARSPDEPMPTIARRIPEPLIEPLARYFSER